MKTQWVVVGLLAALVLRPGPAAGQCGGGASMSGHDHAVAASTGAGSKAGDPKTRQAIERLLANEKSRAMLMEALLADPAFMRETIARIATVPEWHAYAAQQLAAAGSGVAPAQADSVNPARTQKPEAALYRCPMHKEVTSSRPGQCPKCGMALRRET